MIQIAYVLLLLNSVSHAANNSDSPNDTFIPTKEWQTVRDGQAIPAGLHVRINLETGKKEAKLLDDDDSKKDLTVLPDTNDSATGAPTKSSQKISKTLEEALKKIPGDTFEGSSFDSPEETRRRNRTYEELKEVLKEINMNVETDTEIITRLIKDYKNFTIGKATHSQYAALLDDINYLVHQIDNSLWFIQEGAVDSILLPMIVNQTDVVLRAKSLRILGALCQNNPKAQIMIFGRNFGSYLSQILITSSNSEELSTCLYAFGGLLRRFPYAQKEILSKYGTKALISVLNRDTELKIKIKAMTFIGDLLVEKEEETSPEAMKQYEEVLLETWLKDNKFCDIVLDFVVKSQNQLVVNTDLADYLAQALKITQTICSESWTDSAVFKNALMSIRDRFEGTEEEYLVEIAQGYEELIKVLYGHNLGRDEL